MDASIRNVILFGVIWASVHSVLASDAAKRLARRWFGPNADRGYRVAFVVFSAFTLIPIFPLVYGQPVRTLYVVPPPWRWLMIALEVLAAAGVAAVSLQIGLARVTGLAQMRAGVPTGRPTLQQTGMFRYFRHPQYVCSFLLIWLTPFMITTLLTAYVLATLYFVIGSFLEERKLLLQYGDAYRAYRQRVPRFLPVVGRLFLRRSGG